MNLNWGTCGNNGTWCGFLTVNLDDQYFYGKVGIYIIWQANGPIIRVGQGVIKERLQAHRRDTHITIYKNLLVTWAVVSSQQLDSVERYLGDRLKPLVGEHFPNALPVPVNLPWKDF